MWAFFPSKTVLLVMLPDTTRVGFEILSSVGLLLTEKKIAKNIIYDKGRVALGSPASIFIAQLS